MSRITDYSTIRAKMVEQLTPQQLQGRITIAGYIETYLAGPPKRKLTQIADLKRLTLWRYLTYQSVPPPEQCQLLARAIGVAEDDLLVAAGHRSAPPDDDHAQLALIAPLMSDNMTKVAFRLAGELSPQGRAKLAQYIVQLHAEESGSAIAARPFYADLGDEVYDDRNP